MRFIDSLCPPALLYLIYTTIHIGLDLSLGLFATALIKSVMAIAGVVILDALCSVELGVVSWVIVATPFIMVALASSISLGLGLDRLAATAVRENFYLTADNSMNKNDKIGPLVGDNALPLSSNSAY
jgi:hypothetical protein